MTRSAGPAAWWREARLGVFVHWGPYSVPAWAPVEHDIGALIAGGRRDAFARTPYAEWYENSLRFPGSPVQVHHREAHHDRPYAEFAGVFQDGLQRWDPDGWAAAFAAAGARYVVLVTKHHDGFCLWPAATGSPRRSGWQSGRDIVGELAEAVRSRGLRFGVYYSGGLDWTWNTHPIGMTGDIALAVPRGAYPAYAEAQLRELIDRYRPDVLWNDIAWPAPLRRLRPLIGHYRATVPDGVVNDRFLPWSPLWSLGRLGPVRAVVNRASARGARRDGGIVVPRPPIYDVRTPEFTTRGNPAEPWECVRGFDHGFGYNRNSRPEDFLSREELGRLVRDVRAGGGNLLINVGPRGEDATIPAEQLERLGWLGKAR